MTNGLHGKAAAKRSKKLGSVGRKKKAAGKKKKKKR